jgi:hypothetical protein
MSAICESSSVRSKTMRVPSAETSKSPMTTSWGRSVSCRSAPVLRSMSQKFEHADQMLAGYDASGMTEQLLEYECGLLGQPGAGTGALQIPGFGVEYPPIEAEFLVVHRRSAPDQN